MERPPQAVSKRTGTRKYSRRMDARYRIQDAGCKWSETLLQQLPATFDLNGLSIQSGGKLPHSEAPSTDADLQQRGVSPDLLPGNIGYEAIVLIMDVPLFSKRF